MNAKLDLVPVVDLNDPSAKLVVEGILKIAIVVGSISSTQNEFDLVFAKAAEAYMRVKFPHRSSALFA